MKINIEIDSDKCHELSDFISVQEQHDNGEIIDYSMSVSDLINSLSASTNQQIGHTSELLPKNTILYRDFEKTKHVFIEVPRMQRKIDYSGFSFVVGFPRCIFQYTVKKYKSNQEKWDIFLDKIVAVKGRAPINMETEICSFPYSHVSTDGNVCMGGNQFPSVKNINEIENFHSIFFSSPFGNDYGASTTLDKNVSTLFGDTFCNKDFDDNVLISQKQNFREFFNIQ